MISRGRKTIYSSEAEITRDNVQKVVTYAMQIHELNRKDIKYLIEYEKGRQDILDRVKPVRPEINEKVVENHASQIVNFKTAFVFGSPIRYVQKAEKELKSDTTTEEDDGYIGELNSMCFDEKKHTKDQELAKMFLTCGVGYRGAFPRKDGDNGFSPFRIVNLDPMNTFIVYSPDVFHDPLLAVTYWRDMNDKGVVEETHYTAYTKDKVFQFTDTHVGEVEETNNGIGAIPIVEYRQDYDKMGCFERAIELLNAINTCTSDRINGLAQNVQSFIWFDNVDMNKEDYDELRENGALSTTSRNGTTASVKPIETSLNQNEIQSLSEYLYAQLLQICAIPSREAQSGSTTGQSSMLAGGWQEAEEDAYRLEEMFDEGEKKFLEVVKNILDRSNTDVKEEVKLRDIEIKFSRNKVTNMLVKTQGLLNMKTFGIHPRVAIQTADLFSDPQQVYVDSKDYLDKAYNTELNSDGGDKDLQSDPRGDNPETVTAQQNEQMSFVNSG